MSASRKNFTNTSKAKQLNSQEDHGFVLKHRIAGAAFLLFFGALVIPMLLGAPDAVQEPAIDTNNLHSEQEVEQPSFDLSDILFAGSDGEFETEEVFISKITPVTDNSGQVADEVLSNTSSNDVSVESQRDIGQPQNNSNDNAPQISDQATNDAQDVPKAESKAGSETVAIEKRVEQVAVKPKSETKTKPQPKPKSQVEIGWAVQVGVFTDKKGVSRVVSDLRSKGFKPLTTIVDTNRGKATGTRIWLGPFAQRVEAAKAKAILTEKTGEPGFIRRYP